MRQAGILAAAGIVALETMVNRLAEDHANAQRLAQGLTDIKGIVVAPEKVKTNIVVFEPPDGLDTCLFISRMVELGIKFTYPGGRRVRAVTHRHISAQDIDQALNRINAEINNR